MRVLTRREERLLRLLRQRKHRETEGRFVAEGIRAVEDLLGSELSIDFVAASSSAGDTPRGRALIHALLDHSVTLREVSEVELRTLADTESPQGILAVGAVPEGGLARIRVEREPAVVLVVDAVQDPGNLGTLARTAEALGAAGLVCLPGTVDAWNPKSVRAAMGATFRLPVVDAAWDELAPWLEQNGFQVLASGTGGEAVPEPAPARTALVVGNEGAGISADTRARAHRVVGIPLRGRAESLNVAAAGAILMHQLLR
ncbi:MAG TPA: RNA methyltransferase [Longimicrobium sp.]|uniref:TrmH family RNA methyltransferase n=1 Tax=Longimicrobium sp. TaxID=2029185 RepID=UPI002ED8C992